MGRAVNREPKVDSYLAGCPPGARRRLAALRKLIRTVEPRAEEVLSYGMPGYRLPGKGSKRTFVWFALQRNHIGLYVRPPSIENHRRRLAKFGTTKSAVHLPLEGEWPDRLIRTLVRASSRLLRDR